MGGTGVYAANRQEPFLFLHLYMFTQIEKYLSYFSQTVR